MKNIKPEKRIVKGGRHLFSPLQAKRAKEVGGEEMNMRMNPLFGLDSPLKPITNPLNKENTSNENSFSPSVLSKNPGECI